MCSSFEAGTAEKIADLCDGRMPEFDYARECYPGRDAPIIILDEQGDLTPVRAGFGMLPHWAKLELARRTYNARSETVDKLPSFKSAWNKRQTCLVPVQHFYEPCYESGVAVRHAIGRKDEELTLLAGLWETRTESDGSKRRTFTMLTISGENHPIMQRMHKPEDEKRSVVPIERPDWATWLAPESHGDLRALLRLFDADLYQAVAMPLPPRKKVSAPRKGAN